jgi:YD repeat-containing protein
LIIKQRCRPRYDRAGKKVEALWFFEDGTRSRKYVYRYRLTGELAQELLYKFADDDAIEEKWSTIYDENGNVVETACFDREGRTIAGPTWYKYDDYGNKVEAATRD